jgi:hypothetical protein
MSHALAPSAITNFNNLMDKIGIWVVYTRSDHRFRCRDCFNYFTNDSAPSCSTCFGTGFRVSLERWKVYYTNRISRAAGIEIPLTRAGFNPDHMAYIFTRNKDTPVDLDRVFIVEWDVPRDDVPVRAGRPKRIVQALQILYTEQFYIGQEIYLLNHCGIVQESIKSAYEPILLRTPIPTTIL